MLTTAQHKLTSAIIGAERQRSVQKWRISTVREGGGAALFCNCRFTRQDPTAILHQRSGAYVTSASSLQVEAAWVRGLSLETMPFWPGTSRETNSSPRRATFRLKNTRGPVQTLEAPPLPCKSFGMEQVYGQKQLSIQNIWHELGFGICKTPCFSNIRSR